MTGIRITIGTLALLLLGSNALGALAPAPQPKQDRLFDRCDKNGDGVLERAEFKTAVQHWRKKLANLRRAAPGPRDDQPGPPAQRGQRGKHADMRPGPGAPDVQPVARRRGNRPDDGRFEQRGERNRQRGDAFGAPPSRRGDDRVAPPRGPCPRGFGHGDATWGPMERRAWAGDGRPRNPGPACNINFNPRFGRGFAPGFGACDGPDFRSPSGQDRPRFGGNRPGREARVDRRMQRFDMDRDGAISREEFDRRCDRFDEFDGDDDGTISRDELFGAPARRPRAGMRRSPLGRPDAPPARGDLPPARTEAAPDEAPL